MVFETSLNSVFFAYGTKYYTNMLVSLFMTAGHRVARMFIIPRGILTRLRQEHQGANQVVMLFI